MSKYGGSGESALGGGLEGRMSSEQLGFREWQCLRFERERVMEWRVGRLDGRKHLIGKECGVCQLRKRFWLVGVTVRVVKFIQAMDIASVLG